MKAIQAVIRQLEGGSILIYIITMISGAIRGMSAQNVYRNPFFLREDYLEDILVQHLTRTTKLGLNHLRVFLKLFISTTLPAAVSPPVLHSKFPDFLGLKESRRVLIW
ncbi:hypothetical protein PanWU01x14_271910 [Parasponia andersonii]|uniref:Uncharacterized protein n=1 Tax=Parasponia andersonii TaxID=3476 RepID=A0A2P5B4N5_PARAD|nr:hypothetical protein PanWU01x14_271910 [Parasponia andersonii]